MPALLKRLRAVFGLCFLSALSCSSPEVAVPTIQTADIAASDINAAGRDGVVSSCPVGYFCPINEAPQECLPGFYCPGGDVVVASGQGYYSDKGHASALPCGKGFYCPNQSNTPADRAACDPIPERSEYVSDNEASGDCKFQCIAGFSSVNDICVAAEVCKAGHYCPPGTKAPFGAGPCPAGYFCPEGTVDFMPNVCPEGVFCLEGSVSASGSGSCAPGHACPKGSKSATEMPSGKGSYVANNEIKPCGKGLFCPLEANSESDRAPCANGVENSEYIDEFARSANCALRCKRGFVAVEDARLSCVKDDTNGGTNPPTTVTTTTLSPPPTPPPPPPPPPTDCVCSLTRRAPGSYALPDVTALQKFVGKDLAYHADSCSFYVAGTANVTGLALAQHSLARVCANTMKLDKKFAAAGATYMSNAAKAAKVEAVAVDSKNNWVYTLGTQSSATGALEAEIVLVRWQMNGVMDAAFGAGGQKILGRPARLNAAYSLIVDDGIIYVLGRVVTNPNSGIVVLWKLKSSGAFDDGFGSEGEILFSDLGGSVEDASAILFDAKTLIVAVQTSFADANSKVTVLKVSAEKGVSLHSLTLDNQSKVAKRIVGLQRTHAQAARILRARTEISDIFQIPTATNIVATDLSFASDGRMQITREKSVATSFDATRQDVGLVFDLAQRFYLLYSSTLVSPVAQCLNTQRFTDLIALDTKWGSGGTSQLHCLVQTTIFPPIVPIGATGRFGEGGLQIGKELFILSVDKNATTSPTALEVVAVPD